MNKIIFIIANVFALFSSQVLAQELMLTNSVLSDGGKTPRTEAQKAANGVVSTVLGERNVDPYSAVASTNFNSGSVWYRLYDDMKMFAVDVSTQKYLGSWFLGSPKDPCAGDETCSTPWTTGRWNENEFLETDIVNRITMHGLTEPFAVSNSDKPSVGSGCLVNNPLRYGDINADNKNELIVFAKNAFVVFSPEIKKTIFATMLDVKDWMPFSEQLADGIVAKADNPQNPQYGSRMLHENNRGTGAAYRGYAKLYFDHFDADTAHDIVVWRKFYVSRIASDPIKGFEKKSDTFIHYELIDGEYKKQPTDSATVKTWLTAKQLTWQKGYPSKSECPGQVGQLIPEMHDPLLNDAEVMQ